VGSLGSLQIALLVIGLLLPLYSLPAQIGLGIGLASTGEDIKKAGGELEDVLQKDVKSLTYGDLSGEVGFYGKIGFKKGLGGPRIAADVSYVYFQNSQIKLTALSIGQGTEISATFEVGTSLIPISLGLEYALSIPILRPYAGAYPVYTFVNRTFTHIGGTRIASVENQSAGENEFGLGFEGGAEFAFINNLTITLSGRFTVANMFTADNDEGTLGLLQLGASIWFGDIIGNEKREEGESVESPSLQLNEDN